MPGNRERLISVIVPVYKVEPYLRCCIDSILAQTFADFELILVDDGSPDNCGAICDEYAAKDDRIVVIHQENGGLSAARNTGLDWVYANSSSQWITFVDSDDAIVPTFLAHLYKYASESDADIITTSFTCCNDTIDLDSACHNVVSAKKLTGRDACKMLYCGDGSISVMAWGKLFHRELFAEIRFPVGMWHEDEAVIPIILHTADSVISLRAWLYCYRQTPGSIMNRPFSAKRFDRFVAFDVCINYYKMVQDAELLQLAEKRKRRDVARDTIKAYKIGIAKELPKQYKMSIVKALYILIMDTLKSGGVRAVWLRAKRLVK